MPYLCKVGLTYPVGEKNIKHAQKGDMHKVTEWKRVEAGEVADDIPACSLDHLLASGKVEAVDNVAPLPAPVEDVVA